MKQLLSDNLQRTFILTVVCMMFPFPIACLGLLVALLYLLIKKPLHTFFKPNTFHYSIWAILILSAVSSCIAHNWFGLSATIALVLFYLYSIYYERFIKKETFHFLLHIMLGFSVLHAFYAFLQNKKILFGPDYHSWHPDLISWKDGRADSVFFNPNYYATVCAFFILIALYCSLTNRTKKYIPYYMGVILANLLGIFFTQTRSILPALLTAFIAFSWGVQSQKLRKLAFVLCIATILCLPLIHYFPRFDFFILDDHFQIRLSVWDISLQHFYNTYLIGSGPFSYFSIFKQYNGYPTQHAHNIYIDSLLNFGIIGSILLVFIGIQVLKYLHPLKKINRPVYALSASFIILMLTYGVMDVTVFWVHTLFIFTIIVFNKRAFYKKESKRSMRGRFQNLTK